MVKNAKKVTEPDFSGKVSFAQIWAKRVQNGPKMDFFYIFSIFKKCIGLSVHNLGMPPLTNRIIKQTKIIVILLKTRLVQIQES